MEVRMARNVRVERAGVRSLVVEMPASLRFLYWFVIVASVVVLDGGAFATGKAAASAGIIAAGIAWLIGLRGLHQRIVYGPSEIRFRNLWTERTVESSWIAYGWLRFGGGVLVLVLTNGSLVYFDAGDWRYGKRRAMEREAIVEGLSAWVEAPYASRVFSEEDLAFDPPPFEPGDDPRVVIAKLRASEWCAIAVSGVLAAFLLISGS